MVAQLLSASKFSFGQSPLSAQIGKLFFVSSSLPFNMQAQTQTNWCWAATSSSVSHFYFAASQWSQCLIASSELSRTDCCNSPVPSACNVPWYLDRALTRTSNFQSIVSGTIPFSTICSEIAAGRVIGARIGWNGGGGHFMCIYGCSTVGAVQYVDIADPIYGNSHITLTTFTNSYQGSGQWTHTYFTKRWPTLTIKLPPFVAEWANLIREQRPLLALKHGETERAAKPAASLGVPHYVYVMGLADLSGDKPVPREPTSVRLFEIEDGRSTALFELTPPERGAPQLQGMTDDPAALDLLHQALTEAQRVAEQGTAEPELSLLRVPALYVEAYWLHYTDQTKDMVVPVRAIGLFTPLQPVPAGTFFDKLRAAARERLKTPGEPTIAP
jgi:hypothetical protein